MIYVLFVPSGEKRNMLFSLKNSERLFCLPSHAALVFCSFCPPGGIKGGRNGTRICTRNFSICQRMYKPLLNLHNKRVLFKRDSA